MININGTLFSRQNAFVDVENRGFQYGDAVFETLRVSSEKIFFWENHYFRLMASMRILRMEIPMNFSMEFLENEVLKTIKDSKEKSLSFRVKIIVSRKPGGKYTPETNDIDYLIISEKLDTSFYTFNDSKYKVELYKDHFINSGLLSTLKTNSKTIHVLGSIFAKENTYDNCLLLNEKKQVVEALNGNIFLVNGKTIITPPIEDGCLRGILRKQIISICKQIPEYTLEESSISPFDLQKADELFITNVIQGIQPVTNYRRKNFSIMIAKELLQKLNVKARLT